MRNVVFSRNTFLDRSDGEAEPLISVVPFSIMLVHVCLTSYVYTLKTFCQTFT